jgi:hypothetical protein
MAIPTYDQFIEPLLNDDSGSHVVEYRRHEEFEAMLKKPRDSSDGKPARPPKAKRPRCGARTRRGTSCKAPAVWFSGEAKPRNGRCRNHGGLNPKWGDSARSVESRKQSAAAIGLEYDELTGRCHKPK